MGTGIIIIKGSKGQFAVGGTHEHTLGKPSRSIDPVFSLWVYVKFINSMKMGLTEGVERDSLSLSGLLLPSLPGVLPHSFPSSPLPWHTAHLFHQPHPAPPWLNELSHTFLTPPTHPSSHSLLCPGNSSLRHEVKSVSFVMMIS